MYVTPPESELILTSHEFSDGESGNEIPNRVFSLSFAWTVATSAHWWKIGSVGSKHYFSILFHYC